MLSEAYLRANSRLPGPRANLELLGRAAEEVDRNTAMSWGSRTVGDDATDVFVVMVGLAGLGKFAATDEEAAALLRKRANDAEWRVREAVAIALQRVGDDQPERLGEIARQWVGGTPLQARAAVAGVAEPRLVRDGSLVPAALDVLDAATEIVAGASPTVANSGERALRQALGYAWSVVVAADPAVGWPRFQRWAASSNADVAWIVAENLKKDRLKKLKLGDQ
jgi:hypothetical protein